MAYSDRELLARLIKCEAEGEGDIGMKAVASVIINRVNVPYGEYHRIGQGSIRKVILQKYQFTCCMTTVNGQVNYQNIYAANPTQLHYDIADWAIAGHKITGTGGCLWYYNPFSPICKIFFPATKTGVYNTRIRQHCFYLPTPSYAKT